MIIEIPKTGSYLKNTNNNYNKTKIISHRNDTKFINFQDKTKKQKLI